MLKDQKGAIICPFTNAIGEKYRCHAQWSDQTVFQPVICSFQLHYLDFGLDANDPAQGTISDKAGCLQ